MITNRKGLSDVVTTVLIILLVLAAVVIVGTYVLQMVSKGGDKISGASVCTALQLEPVTCTYTGTAPNLVLSVKASKKGTDATVKSLSVILEKADGTTVSKTGTAPAYLETSQVYTESSLGSMVYSKVSLVTTVTTDSGDSPCPETTKITCA